MATTWTTESNTQAISTVSTLDTTLTLDDRKSFIIKNKSGVNRFQVANATGNAIIAGDLDVGANLNLGSSSYMTLSNNEIDVSSGDLTLDVAGDIVLDADGGDITFKDSGVTLTSIDSSGNVSITGDLKVTGNDIQDNDGVSCIIFDSSGNTTISNNCSGTFIGNITGNVTGNVTGDVIGDVTGNISGNAGTVSSGVYTAGNQTIDGTKTFSSNIIGNLTGNITGNIQVM